MKTIIFARTIGCLGKSLTKIGLILIFVFAGNLSYSSVFSQEASPSLNENLASDESDDELFNEFGQFLSSQQSSESPVKFAKNDEKSDAAFAGDVENRGGERLNVSLNSDANRRVFSQEILRSRLTPNDSVQRSGIDSAIETNAKETSKGTQTASSGVANSRQTFSSDANEQSELDVNDVNQFTKKNRTGQSAEDLDALSNDSLKSEERTLRSLESKPEETPPQIEEDSFNGDDWDDECLTTLEPYFSLFREYPATISWTKETESLLRKTLGSLSGSPQEAKENLLKLKEQIARLEQIKETLIRDDGGRRSNLPYSEAATSGKLNSSVEPKGNNGDSSLSNPSSVDSLASRETKSPTLTERYSLDSRLEIVDSLRFALDRRLYLWSLAVPYYEAKNQANLVAAPTFSPSDIQQLKKKTIEVRDYFGVTPIGQKWRAGFEIDLLLSDIERIEKLFSIEKKESFRPIAGLTNVLNSQISNDSSENLNETAKSETERRRDELDESLAKETRFLCDRTNSIDYKIRMTPMNADQKKIFEREPLKNWLSTLQRYTCDQTDAKELLGTFEQYERTSGGRTGVQLHRLAYRMKSSRSSVCQRLGEGINVIYDNPNAKFYISELLINRLLPIRDPEFDVVQETILNNPVAGRRRTDTEVSIKLIPDNERLLMNLNVNGKVIAATSSSVFSATLYNESYATYRGQKQIEWKNNGILYSPVRIAVNNSNQLSGVQTEIDFVPIIGDIAREMARGQYESKQGDIERETRQRITQEAKNRIDLEANERFDATNARIQANFFRRMEKLGLSLKMQNSKTTDDWILASLRLATVGSLGGQTAEPATLRGAFADCKIHESALNTAISRLELDGKSFEIDELIDYLSKKLECPSLKNASVENVDLFLEMDEIDPITIRFFEDRIQLRLAFRYIELGKKSWENITVVVSYRPTTDSNGRILLVRDGLIQLKGPLGVRAQLPLRAIFSKIFPAEKEFPIDPAFLKTDERFAGLTVGLCRATRGWFAVSIVLAKK